MKGKRRKECTKCGRSFLAKEGRERYKQWKKKAVKNNEDRKGSFHKYSRSS